MKKDTKMPFHSASRFLLIAAVIGIIVVSGIAAARDFEGRELTFTSDVTIMAVGDIMMHSTNIKGAWDPVRKEYDFSPFFEYVTPVFDSADWVLGNFETRLAGENTPIRNKNGEVITGYTGFPFFNAPDTLARDLARAGFTLVGTANNHALDRLEAGVINTNRRLDEAGIITTGTFNSPSDRDSVRILEKDGISMAVFAYTYSTNGVSTPPGKDYIVNYIDYDRIYRDITLAKAKKVDFIACNIHFGTEYQRTPDETQLAVADSVISMGADIILGHHPHVVQPWKYITDPETGKRKLIIYSMGNFISNQMKKWRDVGVIFRISLKKDLITGESWIESVETMPTKVYRYYKNGRRDYRILVMSEVLKHPEAYDNLPDELIAEIEDEYSQMTNHLASMHDDNNESAAASQ